MVPLDPRLTCPDCGALMMIREGPYGKFYGCSRFPHCRTTHGAHADGTPLGIPGNAVTKEWRKKAHTVFDTLWCGDTASMSRNDAYRWMQDTLALSQDEAHIGRFGEAQCRQLIAAVEKRAEVSQLNSIPNERKVRARRAWKKHRKRANRFKAAH